VPSRVVRKVRTQWLIGPSSVQRCVSKQGAACSRGLQDANLLEAGDDSCARTRQAWTAAPASFARCHPARGTASRCQGCW
jgi:hypothetical protein